MVHQKFKEWLRKILGENRYGLLGPKGDGHKQIGHATESGAMRKLIQNFEVQKQLFHKQSTRTYIIDLPRIAELESLTIPGKIDCGALLITRYTPSHDQSYVHGC